MQPLPSLLPFGMWCARRLQHVKRSPAPLSWPPEKRMPGWKQQAAGVLAASVNSWGGKGGGAGGGDGVCSPAMQHSSVLLPQALPTPRRGS